MNIDKIWHINLQHNSAPLPVSRMGKGAQYEKQDPQTQYSYSVFVFVRLQYNLHLVIDLHSFNPKQ